MSEPTRRPPSVAEGQRANEAARSEPTRRPPSLAEGQRANEAARSEPIKIANEFAAVTVTLVETRNGVRLRIESPRLQRSIDLDPLELESLTWQSHDLFTGFLAEPYGPDEA